MLSHSVCFLMSFSKKGTVLLNSSTSMYSLRSCYFILVIAEWLPDMSAGFRRRRGGGTLRRSCSCPRSRTRPPGCWERSGSRSPGPSRWLSRHSDFRVRFRKRKFRSPTRSLCESRRRHLSNHFIIISLRNEYVHTSLLFVTTAGLTYCL